MTQAFRTNYAVADPERLTQENASAIARLGYDPNTAPRRPSPEEIAKAAQAIFSKITIKQHKRS